MAPPLADEQLSTSLAVCGFDEVVEDLTPPNPSLPQGEGGVWLGG